MSNVKYISENIPYIMLLFIVYSFVSLKFVDSYQCMNLGELQVFYDSTCSNGGAGCNAGGQGQNCRFCGFVLRFYALIKYDQNNLNFKF